MEEIATLSVVGFISALMILVPAARMEVFTILGLIGLLVVRALAGPYARAETNHRIDGFVGLGLVVFVAFVLNRVFEVLSSS
ncbi:MAG: hypothetical protein R3185_07240 [Candidatus Thermoplasmatota archaeon]|nr:hypothetical protein [Candidatus Thermoplasmatota archaeon]